MRRDRVTWAAYLALAVFTFFLNIQGNILPFLRDEFSLSYRWATLHPSALALGLIASGLVGERWIAAFGRRVAISSGLVGLVAGALLIVVAPTPIVSVAGCFLMGFVGGLILVTVPGLLVERHGKDSSAVLGEANGLSYVASLLAALSTGLFLALGLSWRLALVFGAVVVAALLLALRRQALPDKARVEGSEQSGRLPRAFWLYWLGLVGFVGLEQAALVWAPEFLRSAKGLSLSAAATGAGIFSVGMLIGRLSAVPLLKRMKPRVVLHASVVLTIPAFLLYWAASIPAVFFTGLFLLGLGTALLYPLTLAQAIGVCGPLGDTASARASLASGLAVLLLPFLIGTLADYVGLRAALFVLPALSVVSIVCFRAGEAQAIKEAASAGAAPHVRAGRAVPESTTPVG